ncbi:Tryptophan synthase, beta chain [Cynara cardunculus var. scolymus]|uniref:tryptophan synthase n=1 Tax=Cynara cardunculus var. scolymus TaxID=59895 RepID=A0A103XUZ5_CYNCS|nr:Tryptophan synthase, beta chain [Cynara cardunculus var. scolymus]
MELATALKDYVGRETPLYHAQKLTDHYKNINGEGPEIYLKREDLNHGGSYKMNNVIAQAILAKRMGRKSVITATSADRHGVATAAAAASESMREWLGNLETEYYLSGTAVGPHPIPTMVREFNSIIGQETRKQAMEKWGGKPDVLVACVGSGCNALGLFHEFMSDESVRMIGVEGGGGDELHCASLVRASHALAYLEKLCPTLPRGTKVVVNCCGSGYNDAPIVLNDMP